jgi:hypothetical protein
VRKLIKFWFFQRQNKKIGTLVPIKNIKNKNNFKFSPIFEESEFYGRIQKIKFLPEIF